MGSMMQDLAFAIPGVDEAMGFAEIMKHVKSMEYSVIVFDTAPTGHTLRFLSFPTVLEKALSKFGTLGRSFGPMINQMTNMMGGGGGANQQEDMFAKLDSMKEIITEVNTQFKDPVSVEFLLVVLWSLAIVMKVFCSGTDLCFFLSTFFTLDFFSISLSFSLKFSPHQQERTTFVCVMIAEFLSLYETERLVQELTNYEIDTHVIVCNQLLYPKKGKRPKSLKMMTSWKQRSRFEVENEKLGFSNLYNVLDLSLTCFSQVPIAIIAESERLCKTSIWKK